MIICGTASASPDLVVTSVNAANSVSPGSTITINSTVKNNGTETAGGFHVGYYIQDEYAVVKKPATQHNASIYEDTVVWSDYRYNRSDCDIYVKNVTTGIDKYIYPTLGNQSNPAIYGNIIVWQDDTSGHWQILGYKIPNRSDPIAPNVYILYPTSTDQINPSIYQDKIVWQQYNTTTKNWDIYLYDFLISGDSAMPEGKETTQITTNGANHINPYVNGNYIVWQEDDGTGNNWHIYSYDLSTGDIIQLSTAPGNQTNPAIYGDNVVWQQYNTTSKNWDIYMYDLSKDPADAETQITNNTSNQINPAIYGDKIVWQQYNTTSKNWDIYMYDLTLGIERQLTVNTGNQTNPAIYDNKVVWTDDRNGNQDIYMTDDLVLVPEYTRYVSSLAPGKSNNALTKITLPSNLKPDVNYYIIAMVDAAYDNSVSESNEMNNIKIDSTPMIVSNVDLTMPSISSPTKVQSGKSIIIVNTVKNTGTKTSNPFIIKFYLSKDKNITTSDIYIGQRYISTGLRASASSTAYTNITIPYNLSGSYYIGAIVDSTNNASETNKLNNIGICTTNITLYAPDLVATSVSAGSTSYMRGNKMTITNTVKNQGNVTSGGFYIKFYLSKDKTITTSDVCIGKRYISSLEAGKLTPTLYTSLTIPSTIARGIYYCGIIIEPVNSAAESNKSNNAICSGKWINIF